MLALLTDKLDANVIVSGVLVWIIPEAGFPFEVRILMVICGGGGGGVTGGTVKLTRPTFL